MVISIAAKQRIGELLVARGLSRENLEHALDKQKLDHRPLGEILIDMEAVETNEILAACAEQMAIEFISTEEEIVRNTDNKKIDAVGFEWCFDRKILPLIGDDPQKVALVDPSDTFVIQDLQDKWGEIQPVLAPLELIQHSLELWLRKSGKPISLQIETLEDDASVTDWVDHLLNHGVTERASDIHIEALGDKTRVRFRIDGILYEIPSPPLHMHAAIVSRMKVLADLDIAERRLPQDGKFPRFIDGRNFDCRVSAIPTVYGEGVVLRLLERSGNLSLDGLGFSETIRNKIDRIFQRSHGLILATGPTGSGKTTSLYAALHNLNNVDKKLITIEDPVEYDFPGVEQIQVHPKIGLTFAHGLRSVLRHDPDVVLVGEIRDADTAAVAIQAALTGHLVPSTLHTNDAPSAVARLIDMGSERFLVASALVGVLAQRLVRSICVECRVEIEVEDEVRPLYEGLGLDVPDHLYQGAGCIACRGAGFRGRNAIGEIIVVDEAVREAIHLPAASARDIRTAAELSGFTPMLSDGLEKAAAGKTTVSEVLRVALPEWQ